MKVKVTPKEAIMREIDDMAKRWRDTLINSLAAVGEKCVNAARITSMKGRDYKNQTGNLRSSTGYIIVVDGKVEMWSGFGAVGGGTTGAKTGLDYAKSLATRHPKGVALIVVAGMNYAEYVAAKGYDVLDTSVALARKLVPEMLQRLNNMG